MPKDIEELESVRAGLLRELAEARDMRRGSITEAYRRCGKESCHCAGTSDPGHGPYYAYTRKVAGKTKTVQLRPGPRLAKLEREVSAGHAFRDTCAHLLDVSEALCDARPDSDVGKGEKKGIRAALEAEIIREIETLVAPGAAQELDFEAVEIALRRKAMRFAARGLEQRLNADSSDHSSAALPMRRSRAVCRPSHENFHRSARPARAGACILSL